MKGRPEDAQRNDAILPMLLSGQKLEPDHGSNRLLPLHIGKAREAAP
jgi:hypothetical protein